MALSHRDERAPARRWPLGTCLRPGHRRALSPASGASSAMAPLGRDPMSDADSARRTIRPAARIDGARDDDAWASASTYRIRRRRARAHALDAGSVRSSPRLLARAMKLGLTFPSFQSDFDRKPETRPARVATWLEHAGH